MFPKNWQIISGTSGAGWEIYLMARVSSPAWAIWWKRQDGFDGEPLKMGKMHPSKESGMQAIKSLISYVHRSGDMTEAEKDQLTFEEIACLENTPRFGMF